MMRATPTLRSRWARNADALLHVAQWALLVFGSACLMLAIGLSLVFVSTLDAKLDNAFMQGMTAGHQMCPRGL